MSIERWKLHAPRLAAVVVPAALAAAPDWPAQAADPNFSVIERIALAERASVVGREARDPWVLVAATRILAGAFHAPQSATASAIICTEQGDSAHDANDKDRKPVPSVARLASEALALSGWKRPDIAAAVALIDQSAPPAAPTRGWPIGAGARVRCVLPVTLDGRRTARLASLGGDLRLTIHRDGSSSALDLSNLGQSGTYFIVDLD